MDVQLLTKALNFHGQELYRLLDEEQGAEKLQHLDLRTVDYHEYRKRAKDFGFEERQRRQKHLRFIARKADILFKPQKDTEFPLSFDFENEELCGVMPPLESFMGVPAPERRNYLYQCLKPGNVVIGKLTKKQELLYILSLVCMDGGKKREVADLGIKVFVSQNHLPLNSSSDSQGLSQVDDYMRGVVTNTSPMGKILLSFREDMLPPELLHRIKLGVISEEEVPSHHKRYLANEGKTYADVLKHTLSFNNPATSLHMCNLLAVPVGKTTSLIHSLDDMIITKDDTAIALRKAQSAVWAYKSVKEGIAYFKAGNNTEAFQCLNKSLQIDPENVEALVARGALFANNNNLRRALEDFEEALSLNPNHSNGRKYTSETLVALGKYYEEKLDLVMAKKTYKKALQVNSQNVTAKESLLAIEEQERKKMLEQRTLDYAAVGTIPLNTNIAIGQIEKPSPTKAADTREKLKLLLKEEKKEKYKRERYSSLSSPPHSPPSFPTKVALKEEVKKEEQKWITTEMPIEKKPELPRNVDVPLAAAAAEEVQLPEARPIKRKSSESKYDDPVKRSYAVDKAFRDMLFKEAEKKLKASQEVQTASVTLKEEPKTEPSLEDRLAMYYKKHGYGKDSSESEKSHVSEDYRSIVKATKFSKKSKKQKSKKRKHAKDSSSDDMREESSKKRKSRDKSSGRPPSPKVVFVMRKDDDIHYSKLYTHAAFRDDDDDDDQKGKEDQKENDEKKSKHEQGSDSSSRSSSQSSSGSGSRSRSHSRSRSKSSEEKKVKKKKRKRNYDSEDDEHKYDESNQREKQFRFDRHRKSNFNAYGEDKYYKYEKGAQKYDRYYEKYNQYDNYNRGYKYYDDYGYKYPKYEKYNKYERGGKYDKGDGYSSRYIANDDKDNPKERKDAKDAGKRYSYSSTSTRSKSRSKSRSKTPSKSRSKSRSKSHSKSRSKSHSKSRSKSKSKSPSNSRSRSRSKSPSHYHRHRDERYHRDYHYQHHHQQQQRYFRGRRFFRQPYRYHNRGRFYQNRPGFRRFNWKTGSGPAVGHLISRAPSPETLKKVQQAAKQQKALKAEVEREQEALTIQKITKAVVMQNWVDEENKSLEAARAAAKKITESLSKNSGDEKGGKSSLKEMESFLEQLKAQKRDKGDVKHD